MLCGLLVYFFGHAGAFTGNNGDAAWGDSTVGRLRVGAYTFSTNSYSASFRPATAPDSSNIQFVVNKASPTRNEKLIGYQLNDGTLYMASCTSSCSALSNLNASVWHQTIFGSNTLTRGFDIAYEQLSGRAMIVYAGNTTGKLYYCIWDGSSWGPVSTCAPTNGTNDISLTDGTTTLTGTPQWVTLAPYGGQLSDTRSNDILLAVQDSNNDIFVTHWNGSAWTTTDRQVVTTTGGASVSVTEGTVNSPAFDIGWESLSAEEMIVYANGTALSYRTSTGSGWSGASTISTLSTAAQWIKVASDPQSNRMSMMVAYGGSGVGGSATGTPYIWKTDGSTVGWTSFSSITMAQDGGQNISTVWEKANGGTPKAIFSASANANTQQPDWTSWTQSGGLASWAALSTTSGDIIVGNELIASPNSDIITMLQNDRDGKLRARTFDGSSWSALITTNLSTVMSNTFTGRSNNQTYTQKPYQFAYTPYSAYSLNWRAYSDYATAGTPQVPMAAEDTTPLVAPSSIVRLRVNVAELGGQGQTSDTNGVRKKLQFSSGAGCPDSITCTWTDVGAQASGTIWRYAAGGLSDDSVLSGTVLDGSTVAGVAFTNGTASAPNSVQAAGTVEEYDYTLQNNGATTNTSYYFRVYDYGASTNGGAMTNLNALYREQILNTAGTEHQNCTNGTSNGTCTYPTLEAYTSGPNPPVFVNTPAGSSTPAIQVVSSDIFNNYIQYVIEWCPTNSWPCSNGGSFDETSSQSGWSGQDADSGQAYTGSSNINQSTVATYQVSPGVFAPGTTYYLRAKSYDPGGFQIYSSYSSTISFTTASVDVLIKGGTCIGGVGSSCTSGSGATINKVKIGN